MNRHPILLAALLLPSALSAGTVKVTADDAVRRALEVSHVSAAAGERAAASEFVVKAADAAALPSLSLSASATERSSVPEYRIPIPVAPGTEAPVLVPDIRETYGAGVRAQQVLYAGGAIDAQRRAARFESSAQTAQKAATDADLALQARSAYWEAVRAAASLEATRAQEKRALRLADDTKAMLDAGVAVRADLLAAQERAARARLQVVRAEAASGNALGQLRSLLSVPLDDEVELASSLALLPPDVPRSREALQAEALERRPETRVLAAQREALKARETLAAAPGKPSLAAQAQYDYARPNQRYFPQQDEWKGSWAVSLGASFSVFDGGKWRADVAGSRAVQRAADQEIEELRRRIRLEVETSLRDFQAALSAVASADLAREAAAESEKAAQERREAGLAALLEVLDAQSQLANAETEQIQVRAAAWTAAARLGRATGR